MSVDQGLDQAENSEGEEGCKPRERRTEKSVAFNKMCLLILNGTCPECSDDVQSKLKTRPEEGGGRAKDLITPRRTNSE